MDVCACVFVRESEYENDFCSSVWVGERKRLGGWEGNMSTMMWLITLLIMLTTSKQNNKRGKLKKKTFVDRWHLRRGLCVYAYYGKWVDPTSIIQKIIKKCYTKINTITSAKLAVTVGLLSLCILLFSRRYFSMSVCVSVRLPFAWHTVLSSYFTLSLAHSFVPWSPWSAWV